MPTKQLLKDLRSELKSIKDMLSWGFNHRYHPFRAQPSNITLFHYSMIEAKAQTSKIHFFYKIENLRYA
jgi:hypothetical protein